MTRNEFFKTYRDFLKCAIRLYEKARREGLLSLEEEIEDLDEENFKTGLRLVVDGVASEIIDEIFSNIIAFEKDENERQFKIIQKRAILGLQRGENFRILFLVLNSYANLSKDEQKEIEYDLLNDSSGDSDDLDLDD